MSIFQSLPWTKRTWILHYIDKYSAAYSQKQAFLERQFTLVKYRISVAYYGPTSSLSQSTLPLQAGMCFVLKLSGVIRESTDAK